MSYISSVSPYDNPAYNAHRARTEAREERARRGRRGQGPAPAADEAEETQAPEETSGTEVATTASQTAAIPDPMETAAADAPAAEDMAWDDAEVEETGENGESVAAPSDDDGSEESTGTAATDETDGDEGASTNPDDWEVVASSDPEDTDKTGETKETEQTDAEKAKQEAAALAAYKTQFQAKLTAIASQGHLTRTAVKLDITDAGYKRMMEDPAYEKQILDMFRRDLGTTITFPPSSATLTVDGKTEKTSVSYANNLGTTSATRNLLGTMRKTAMRSGLDLLQSQVAAVLEARLGSSDLSGINSYLTNNSGYTNPYSQGSSSLDTKG